MRTAAGVPAQDFLLWPAAQFVAALALSVACSAGAATAPAVL